MAGVLELCFQCKGLARCEAAVPCHACIFQHSFVGFDDDVAFVGVTTIDSGVVHCDIGAIGYTRIDAETEAAHGSGGIGSQNAKTASTITEGNIGIFSGQSNIGGASRGIRSHILEGDAQIGVVADVCLSWSVAVNSEISAFKGSSGNRLDIRNAVGSSHADGDIAAGCDRIDRDLDGAILVNEGSAMKHTIFADGHVGTRNGAHLVGAHADGKDCHVAHLVGSRLHTVRHDGTITYHMVGLPIIECLAMKFITKGLGGIAGKKADIKNGIHCVIDIIHPDGIVDAHTCFLVGRHGAVSAVGGAHAKIIVIFPSGVGAGADIGVSALVFGTDHGLTETCGAVAPVARLAAVADGKEVLVSVGQVSDIIDIKRRTGPAGLAAVGGVVGKADTGTQIGIAIGIIPMAELIHVVKTMFGIVVIVGGIPNGRTTHRDAPATVLASDEECVVQIARVGHGVLLVFQSFVENGGHLSRGLGGDTAVVHVNELVAVNA